MRALPRRRLGRAAPSPVPASPIPAAAPPRLRPRAPLPEPVPQQLRATRACTEHAHDSRRIAELSAEVRDGNWTRGRLGRPPHYPPQPPLPESQSSSSQPSLEVEARSPGPSAPRGHAGTRPRHCGSPRPGSQAAPRRPGPKPQPRAPVAPSRLPGGAAAARPQAPTARPRGPVQAPRRRRGGQAPAPRPRPALQQAAARCPGGQDGHQSASLQASIFIPLPRCTLPRAVELRLRGCDRRPSTGYPIPDGYPLHPNMPPEVAAMGAGTSGAASGGPYGELDLFGAPPSMNLADDRSPEAGGGARAAKDEHN
eukprot:XP_008671349.1 uncharacterized protein LOC103648712 [Zea mays]